MGSQRIKHNLATKQQQQQQMCIGVTTSCPSYRQYKECHQLLALDMIYIHLIDKMGKNS